LINLPCFAEVMVGQKTPFANTVIWLFLSRALVI